MPFLKWRRRELRQTEQMTRKLMAKHWALHSRDDIEYMYQVKKGGRGFASIEDCVDASKQELKNSIKKSQKRLITAASDSSYNIRPDRKTVKTRKQKRGEKQMYGDFKWQSKEIANEKSWT